ncbi:uncharacterized protein IL334_007497 [Kwoniella shivajii]|uniref:Glycosyl transferase CAP10 domain-containing protein n=1 Tax=Kwoniella shivajii TaxID=564305 RepID=A0ABZ1DAN7_9TREE|nr:hypothetical protein IL334_007497 [Kwoniella shivajii]
MSLRPHTYSAPSVSPPTISRPLLPDSSSSITRHGDGKAQERHREQLLNYKRDPSKSRSVVSIRLANLQKIWAKADQRRNKSSHDRLEDGDEDEDDGEERDEISSGFKYRCKGKRRNWFSRYSVSRLHKRSLIVKVNNNKWILYIVGLFLLYLVIIKPILTFGSHGKSNSSKSKKHLGRSSVPRAPLPPAILSKKSNVIEHVINEDSGLLQVNPKSTVHPIYQLIRDARSKWDDKVSRQSKTLLDATKEYQTRYGRKPPKGFDKWWNYVVENDVLLPDEYDQINKDLYPFRALSPRDLNKRIKEASKLSDTYTLKMKRGSMRTNVFYSADIKGANERLEQQVELIKPITHMLPDMEVVWSIHDTPRTIIGWDHRRELSEHVEEDEWFHEDEEIDLTLSDWSSACPPKSPIKSFNPYYFTNPTSFLSSTTSNKRFISSHQNSMDICKNPNLIPIHGYLTNKKPFVNNLTPIFTLSKTNLHSDILGVPVEQWVEDSSSSSQDPVSSWENKQCDKLLWRGSNTGIVHSINTSWRNSHRTRLVSLTHYHDDDGSQYEDEDVNLSQNEKDKMMIEYIPPPKGLKIRAELEKSIQKQSLDEWNKQIMDLSFTGTPIQCDQDDGTCDDLLDEFSWVEHMSHEDEKKYKYILDVDGNAWSARFMRLLSSGSLILKATIMPEWWTDRIQAWVHYVPIQMDYSDLYDVMAFFHGTSSIPGESALAQDIAGSGLEWSSTYWRKEDMTAYMFRLYLEWGRLVHHNRKAMDFDYDPSMEKKRE